MQRGSSAAAAVLDAPEAGYASAGARPGGGVSSGGGGRAWQEPAPAGALQRGYPAEIAEEPEFGRSRNEEEYQPRRGAGRSLRLNVRSLLRSVGGRIVLGAVAVIVLGSAGVGAVVARSYLLHDPRFVIAGSDGIAVTGNQHLTRGQVLSVFGGDLERNIFRVSLAERKADLERLPWVEQATVMRLLPNQLRVAIKERTPVAFVRQGTQIGLVDASGVLLDMPESGVRYSFPVLTGIAAGDSLAVRGSRMALYERFMKALDQSATGGKDFSKSISEVDVSDPEDVKALVETGGMGAAAEILVHFGQEQFLSRYEEFASHLGAWRQQYPRLASADMRYEGQIVLEMRKDAVAAPAAAAPDGKAGSAKPVADGQPAAKAAPAKKAVAKSKAKPAAKKATVKKAAAGSAAKKANERMYAELAAQRKKAQKQR